MRDLPTLDDPWIGKVLDERFEVLGLLGRGGMGAIYRCRDARTGTELAIKIVHDDLSRDAEVMARFEREIRTNCEVVHPNVVRTLGHGRTADGRPYFAMELLRGRPLDELLEDEDPTSTLVAHVGGQVALGLHAAHEKGIVHRDLKPSNVVVGDDGTAKVFDFGLSIAQAPERGAPQTRLTELGLRIGTPIYMAPEYIEGGQLDPRSDLYALGVVLYECCTGAPPFTGSAYQVLHRHATEAPRSIDAVVPGRHPAWLRDVVHALLEKDPALRPRSGAEVAARLARPPELQTPLTTLSPATGDRDTLTPPAQRRVRGPQGGG